jgi:integrase/recombinase XerD
VSQPTITKQKWAVASYHLQDAYTDFILSRQAMLCSPATLRFYSSTAGKFMQWLEQNGVLKPEEISTHHVHAYLSGLVEKKLSDWYINGHARAIKTTIRFFHEEKYIPELIKFKMPAVAKKRLLSFNIEQVQQIIKSCSNPRDKALILLLVDSGLRRAEVCTLDWADIDISTGIVRVERGKGGKARSVIIGVHTRRALLKYRHEISHEDNEPVFQTVRGKRITHDGLRSLVVRVGKQAGIHITPHALRRTFATLSLRAGMNLIQLQGLLGHSTLEMTRHYVDMMEEDLVQAHREHGPIDSFIK